MWSHCCCRRTNMPGASSPAISLVCWPHAALIAGSAWPRRQREAAAAHARRTANRRYTIPLPHSPAMPCSPDPHAPMARKLHFLSAARSETGERLPFYSVSIPLPNAHEILRFHAGPPRLFLTHGRGTNQSRGRRTSFQTRTCGARSLRGADGGGRAPRPHVGRARGRWSGRDQQAGATGGSVSGPRFPCVSPVPANTSLPLHE